MATSGCPAALISLPPARPRYWIVSSNSVCQKGLNRQLGLSFRTDKRLRRRKPASGLCVSSSLGDTKVAAITSKSWDKLVLESDTPVLVEFHGSWCGPCGMVHDVIDEIARDYSGKLKCFVVDIEKDPAVAEKYEVFSVPRVLLFKKGKQVESIMGTMPKEFYTSAIDRLMA